MEPVYEYSETGKAFPIYAWTAPFLGTFISFVVLTSSLTSGGQISDPVNIVAIIGIVLAIVFSQQMLIRPVLKIQLFKDRIEIYNYHGSRMVQSWVIDSNDIANILFLETSPYYDMDFGFGDELIRPNESFKRVDIPHTIIALGKHKSAVVIEQGAQCWLICIDEAESLYHEMISLYTCHGYYQIRNDGINQPAIEISRPYERHFIALRKYLFMGSIGINVLIFNILLALIIPWDEYSVFGMIVFLTFLVLVSIIGVSIFIMNAIKKYSPLRDDSLPVVKAYRDKLQVWLRRPRGKSVSIPAEKIRDINTVYVEDGNYSKLSGYIEGFRMQPKAGTHDAVAIITDKERYAFDIPYPAEAAAALREFYRMKSLEEGNDWSASLA